MSRVLVTGATGFLGSHLVRDLVKAMPARQIRTLAQGEAPWLDALGVEVVRGSVTSADAVARAVDGVDRIYHLAGFVSRRRDDAHRMYEVHVEGTRLLCKAAITAGVKRIVMSSTSGTVAVARRADEMPDESSPTPIDIIARWPYYASKHYQEESARRACSDKVELVIVNPSLLLGPGDDRLSSTGDVMSFLAGDVALIPTGGLNFVDARDVAAVLPVAMERGRTGERYLLGAANWTFADFFGRLARMTKVDGPRIKLGGPLPLLAARAQAALLRRWGRTPPIEPQSVEMAEYFWTFDSKKAREELDFAPRDPTETLLDTVTYIRQHFMASKPGSSALRRALA